MSAVKSRWAHQRRLCILGCMTAATLAVSGGEAVAAAHASCDARTNNTYSKLLECVRVEGVAEHLEAFQAIADANGDTRAANTPGYDASVTYVADRLEAAGWNVELDPFTIQVIDDPTLRQLTPIAAVHETGAFTGTGFDDVTGPVIPVDLALTGARASTSGCEAADFAGLDFSGPNDIALIQRGSCNYLFKAINAEAAGAEAVVIFNQGDAVTPGDRFGTIVGTLGGPNVVDIPVVGASFDDGVALAAAGSTAQVAVPEPRQVTQYNVIAELPGRTADNVVMAGAHLDSVPAGPGINDNGSGSAALIEIAEQLGKTTPENTLRFAWWGAEERGLLGSTAYVNELTVAERERIALYTNFDMIGSPNSIFMVYDADESSFPAPPGVPIPEGSEAIEELFESYYTLRGEPYDDAQFSGRSDYQAFINSGIPSSGLFTGAEGVKTSQQAAIWGGTAGLAYDPCYHQACDDIDNVDLHALDVNSDSIAFAVLTYAYSTETVNGVPGRKVPGKLDIPAPAGPEGTVGSGGGLHADHESL